MKETHAQAKERVLLTKRELLEAIPTSLPAGTYDAILEAVEKMAYAERCLGFHVANELQKLNRQETG